MTLTFLCKHCSRKVPVQGRVFWCACGKTWVNKKVEDQQ